MRTETTAIIYLPVLSRNTHYIVINQVWYCKAKDDSFYVPVKFDTNKGGHG